MTRGGAQATVMSTNEANAAQATPCHYDAQLLMPPQ